MMTLVDGVLYLNMSMSNDILDEALRAALGMLFKSTFLDNDDTVMTAPRSKQDRPARKSDVQVTVLPGNS
ncbi:hypothetical protein [Dyella sp.]|uniref:hypothetical protein n=1 Tax=Dyella sp. TaxID=1869338 RepID=UPI002B48D6A2|nr:hypothetical protein [Dyella sp.]HKT30702.1 hypothetical protein [Dyella sp.]